jgi:hypothetical protein
MNHLIADYTSHVDTKDFVRAFWIQDQNGQSLVYSDGRLEFSHDEALINVRVIALYLSSRSRYVFRTQNAGFISYTEGNKFSYDTSEVSKECWLSLTQKNNLFLQDGNFLAISKEQFAAVDGHNSSPLVANMVRIVATSGIKVLKEYGLTRFGTEVEESQKFGERVAALLTEGKSIKLYIGCGLTIRPGFLHIDMSMPTSNLVEHELLPDLFRFPIGNELPVPSNSIDFVFSEDFIEHLPQMIQLKFLAEAHRILKPGSVNRVNTPCILDSMRKQSDFTKGAIGVYEKEWIGWGHVNVLSKGTLNEFSELCGYSYMSLLAKNESLSEHHTGDVRPKGDRQGPDANIYADLVK